MTIYDFQINYATWVKDKVSETTLMINPLHSLDTGSVVMRRKDGFQIGGEYKLRQDSSALWFTWGNIEYFVSPNKEGFDLLIGQNVKYSFSRLH
jgi:hypothetical protein